MKKDPKLSCEQCQQYTRSIFCELNSASISNLTEHKVMNTYKRGSTVFYQGNPPIGLYCINSGKVKVSKIGNDGKEIIIRIAGAGDVLGHRNLFSDETFTATATVLEEATICFIDKKFIFKTIEQEPSIALNIIRKFSQEMAAAEARTASLNLKSVRERLAEFILALGETYGAKEGARVRLDIKLTREEIASLIGTANETVIRYISEFRAEGVIEQEGKTLYILDKERLVEIANLSI